jgi:hypothetical protein
MWVLIQESHLHVRKTDCRENKCGRVTRQARERLRTSAALVGTVKATGRSHPAFGVTGPAATKSAVANVVGILSDSVSGKLKAYPEMAPVPPSRASRHRAANQAPYMRCAAEKNFGRRMFCEV